jgi:hypothetical protein
VRGGSRKGDNQLNTKLASSGRRMGMTRKQAVRRKALATVYRVKQAEGRSGWQTGRSRLQIVQSTDKPLYREVRGCLRTPMNPPTSAESGEKRDQGACARMRDSRRLSVNEGIYAGKEKEKKVHR